MHTVRIAVAGGTGVSGKYVVQAAEAAGHSVVVLARSKGVDVSTGAGLAAALEGVEVIVDAANTTSQTRKPATAFFEAAAGHLQEAGGAAGVRRLIVLSIVGIDRAAGFPYYAAKLAHEQAAQRGPVATVILRATQFHEFPAQLMNRVNLGPILGVPRFRVQTVAARTVGRVAVELATAEDPPPLVQLGGPAEAELPALARAVLRHQKRRLAVLAIPIPGRAGRAMRKGALTLQGEPGPAQRVEGPTFEEWLAGGDLDAVTLPPPRLGRPKP